MERPNSFETNHESDSDSKVNFMKSILRMAPVLTSVLAMAACGDKEELNKCQLEVAGIQGALEGVGVKHEAPKVDDLQACKIEKSKLDGIMEGWKLTHPEIKPIKSDSEKAQETSERENIRESDALRDRQIIEMGEDQKAATERKTVDPKESAQQFAIKKLEKRIAELKTEDDKRAINLTIDSLNKAGTITDIQANSLREKIRIRDTR